MFAYMIHEVVMGKERNAPKTVKAMPAETFAELESMGAVREATSEEVAIAGLSPVAVKKAETAPAKASGKKAAATTKSVAAVEPTEPSADPDVDLLGQA